MLKNRDIHLCRFLIYGSEIFLFVQNIVNVFQEL